MADRPPIFRSSFMSPDDGFDENLGKKPVVFDILATDKETSILPDNMKLVLHVNPESMAINYAKIIERIPTKGGFVEQHFGEGLDSLEFNIATGGFMRLYSGLSNITGGQGALDVEGTRRESIAYDKYLDVLALFHNNGSVYDITGKIVFQGFISVTFYGGIYLGVFNDFTVSESADKPYQFTMTTSFTIQSEMVRIRTDMTYQIQDSLSSESGIDAPDLLNPDYLDLGRRVGKRDWI